MRARLRFILTCADGTSGTELEVEQRQMSE